MARQYAEPVRQCAEIRIIERDGNRLGGREPVREEQESE